MTPLKNKNIDQNCQRFAEERFGHQQMMLKKHKFSKSNDRGRLLGSSAEFAKSILELLGSIV